ncbi:MAG: hypothetical protein Q4C50_10260 [Eubacteriales bacterium]|nr:hypothetical protein [Eubacteriales bacterium]
MDRYIHVVAALLIFIYAGTAIWVICRRRTIWGSAGAAAAFLCGAFVIVSVAEAVATFLCWTVVACVAVSVFGIFFTD